MFSKFDCQKNQLCDMTLLWGAYWKNIITRKSSFIEEQVKIIGQIRTDIIPELDNTVNYLPFPELQQKQIITFASQPQRDESARYRAAKDVFSVAISLRKAYVIVKLHPLERHDINYYHEIARTVGCSNYRIIYDIDLYSLISNSKIVITCFSTAGAEAVYFKKPLVIIDYYKHDLLEYYKQKVAYRATNRSELEKIIHNILDGQISINRNAYEEYITNYAFRIDGNATKRYFEIIQEM
jgi:CDP-glycerol glycerophosphotransferase (TagB/SpsB family)